MTCRTRHLARLGDAGWGAHRVLVDSSKTAWRLAAVPFLLARELGQDFQLLHLVRDPRAASWSTVKKAERRGARPVKAARPAFAAADWWIANLACELFGVIYPHPISVCTMRTSRAHRVMQCAICLPRFSQEWRGRPMELTRGTSSMATRCAGAIYRLARSGKTRDGNADMPSGVRVIVSLLTAPLRWRYGLCAREGSRSSC